MTVLDLAELVKELEEKFGVSAAAVVKPLSLAVLSASGVVSAVHAWECFEAFQISSCLPVASVLWHAFVHPSTPTYL